MVIDQPQTAQALDAPDARAAPPNRAAAPVPPDLHRLLKLRVPIIVQLARRTLPVSIVRQLSNGAMLQFEKSDDDALDVMINNRRIAKGECVKVGENFGVRLSVVGPAVDRIRSLGANVGQPLFHKA